MLPIKTLLTALLLAGSALAVPEPVDSSAVEAREAAVELREAAPEAEAVSLDKRACKCAKVKNAGLYCGYCYLSGIGFAVQTGYKDDHVFWCNKQGGCEDLGKRTSCVNSKGPCDGRDS